MLLRFRKHRLALHPTDDEGAAALARIKEGTEVAVEVKCTECGATFEKEFGSLGE